MRLIFSILCIFYFMSAIDVIASDIHDEKTNFPEIEENEVEIVKSEVKIESEKALRVFTVKASESGEYYISAFMMLSSVKSVGETYEVQVNGQSVDIVKPNGDCWQSVQLMDTKKALVKVKLSEGINTIAFVSDLPEIPNVELIKLSKDVGKASLSDAAYQDFIADLKQNKLPDDYLKQKQALIDAKKAKIAQKSYILDNPEGNYEHEMDVDFTYTYLTSFYISGQGQSITFETKNSTADPVMHFFFRDDPVGKGSWSDDDGGVGLNSKLTATINHTGVYYLLVRKYGAPTSVGGVCDIYFQGSFMTSNAPVAGGAIYCTNSVSEELNYFTADLTGDSRIWITDWEYPGNVIAHNDDYSTTDPHDFYWGVASRIKENFNTDIEEVVISSFYSSNPTGNCDLYMNCKNSTISTNYSGYFSNLKADDDIQSAPATGGHALSQGDNYNCISWAGGRVNLGRYFWPPSTYDSDFNLNDWYDSDPQQAFDNFFGNTPVSRFYEAPSYTRIGANESNAIVATWTNIYNDYTHGSVKKTRK